MRTGESKTENLHETLRQQEKEIAYLRAEGTALMKIFNMCSSNDEEFNDVKRRLNKEFGKK